MEYCSGGDLNHFIRSKRALPEHFVKRFLQQLVKAMMYMRENNVAHMDLKPQNILLSSSSHPILKVADFGFAKHVFVGDKMRVMRGSPLYMAPEIICSRDYDARVDLWSIGVILYECLFGRAPFASRNFQELENKIKDSKPVELPYGVEVSEDCRDLLLRLLQRQPDDRISFVDFFNHPFVDIKHVPSTESLSQAIEMVSKAVEEDKKGNYKEAIQLYCDTLEYFMAAIHYEKNVHKKEAIRKKVKEYMHRAEELKTQMKPQKQNHKLERSQSSDPIEELMELFKDDEEQLAALKVLKGAELENSQEDYESAMKHYELGLTSVIKALKVEKKGRRKDLLGQQATKWMTEAEKIKQFLSVRQLKTNYTSSQEEDSDEHVLGQGQCLIQ
ncbi:hypothetical protein KUTeg_018023 [Tegillarca granosa]|uniref:Serine/threonine-protein kinase ULK3 n=1 Tax=Tegillarca granosa TaxID=220873 RepID=A0ABQ9ELZ4_TEGGR|nr:hypothetical protein KUTeg_018023 [Tegillarca granosa]